MRGVSAAGFLAALAPILIWAQTGLVEDAAEAQVTAAEATLVEARQHGDADRLQPLLAPDFIEVNRFGRVLGKRQLIPIARDSGYATDDVKLRIYDSGAVVTGRETDEGERTGSVRFQRVWVHDGTAWVELADQETRISSEPESARLAKATPSTVDQIVAEQRGADANHVVEAAEAPAAEARDIRRVETAYRAAERINDLTVLSRIRAPEFRLVDRLGDVVSSRVSIPPAIKAVQDDDFGVRVHGNLALVIGSVLRTNLTDGATDRFRYSAVWVQRAGQWQVVAEQRTPIE